MDISDRILEMVFLLLVAILLIGVVTMMMQSRSAPVVVVPSLLLLKRKGELPWKILLAVFMLIVVLFIAFMLLGNVFRIIPPIVGNIGGITSDLPMT